MKILIQDALSSHYIDRGGMWTPDIREAQKFSLASNALDFCRDRGMQNMEIVLTFDNPPSEFRIPVERINQKMKEYTLAIIMAS